MFLQQNLAFLTKNIGNLKNFCSSKGLKYRTFQDLLYGSRTNPRADTLIELSDAFNVSIDDLLKKDLANACDN